MNRTGSDKKLPPWKKPAPKSKNPVKLTDEEKAQARERARKAGRRYPNLVDNMAIAKKKKKPRLPLK